MSFHDFWHLSYKCNLLSIPNNRHVISNPIYLGVFPEERINERTKGAWRNPSDVIPMELKSCSVSITVFASGIHAQCNLGQEVIKLEHSEFKIDCLMRSCLEEFPHGLTVPRTSPMILLFIFHAIDAFIVISFWPVLSNIFVSFSCPHAP